MTTRPMPGPMALFGQETFERAEKTKGLGDPAYLKARRLTVPTGQVKGLPVGLSFVGGKWDDAKILSLGFAYEQARGPLPGPSFWRSIGDSPDVARLLELAR